MSKNNKEVTNKTEANLISFKVLLNRKNQIVTELSQFPEKHIDKVFHFCPHFTERFIELIF